MKEADLHSLLLGPAHERQCCPPRHTVLKRHKKVQSRKGVLAQAVQRSAVQALGIVISDVLALCSQSSCPVPLLLRAEAASCGAARVVYLMLTDIHINSLAFPANGDPGLKQKIPEALQCIFMRCDLFCNCVFWLSALYVQQSSSVGLLYITRAMPWKAQHQGISHESPGSGEMKKLELFSFFILVLNNA